MSVERATAGIRATALLLMIVASFQLAAADVDITTRCLLEGGDFEYCESSNGMCSNLFPWTVWLTEFGSVFGMIEPFDVNGDGVTNGAFRFHSGHEDSSTIFDAGGNKVLAGGGIGIAMVMPAGQWTVKADIALVPTPAAGALLELCTSDCLGDNILDSHQFSETLSEGQIERATLSGTMTTTEEGLKTLRFKSVHDTRSTSQWQIWIDDVTITGTPSACLVESGPNTESPALLKLRCLIATVDLVAIDDEQIRQNWLEWLNDSRAYIENGESTNYDTAIERINSFMENVRRRQRQGEVPPEIASTLINCAKRVLEALS